MEEVDQIILTSFANIGCEFAEGLESLKQLTTENVVEATVKCLKIINPDLKMSPIYPPGMSARFRVGSAIAQACQNAGYRDNIGYQTFLYSSESEIRKIFMFLVEKLPRKEGTTEDGGSVSALKQHISQVLLAQCATMWMPPYCRARKRSVRFRSHNIRFPSSKSDEKTSPPFIHQQLSNRDTLSPSVLERNSNDIAQQYVALSLKESAGSKKPPKQSFQWKQKSPRAGTSYESLLTSTFDDVISSLSGDAPHNKQSRFINAKKLQFTDNELVFKKQAASRPSVPKKPDHLKGSKDGVGDDRGKHKEDLEGSGRVSTHQDDAVPVKEETMEERFKREEDELAEIIEDSETAHRHHKEEMKSMEAALQQMKFDISDIEANVEEQKEKLELKKKTVYLLPNAEESMEKLKNLIERSSGRLLSLAKMWDERRVPMIQEIRDLRKKNSSTEFDSEKKLDEIKELRRRMKETGDETKRKEKMVKQLTSELESLKRDISRQSYTKRILEIVSSIHKQRKEIQLVIDDMIGAQKQMNQLRDRTDRTFTAADEAMFKDAKKDDNIRQAYKYLVALHGNCSALVDTVEHTGAIMREIRELEDQIEIETKKNAEDNLLKIMKDYKEMKKENNELLKQLKQN